MPASVDLPSPLLRLRALVVLAAVAAGLRLLPFASVRLLVARAGRTRTGSPPSRFSRVMRAVDSAARFVPGASCLARSLAARFLGIPGRVILGVSRDGAGAFAAHAWLEGSGDGRGFAPVAALGA